MQLLICVVQMSAAVICLVLTLKMAESYWVRQEVFMLACVLLLLL
jgi:hypothetical protein